jgi:hypothetical protein
METREQIIDKLRDDTWYYGTYGQQYLSNSNISTLLTNPLGLKEKTKTTSAMIFGSYFHTAILEKDKLHKFKIIEANTRTTKVYKELSEGEMCMLQHEVDMADAMVDKLLDNNVFSSMINVGEVEHEVPSVKEIMGNMWKGKADIINHDDKLVVDIKTSSDINSFHFSANKYNYDSQAYIYRELFGYDMVFLVIDKNTHQMGLFDCSDNFYDRGREKVEKATEVYDLFYKDESFDAKQFFINRTL